MWKKCIWHRPWSLPVVVVHNSLENNGVPSLSIIVSLFISMGSDDWNVCAIYGTSTHWIALFSKSVSWRRVPFGRSTNRLKGPFSVLLWLGEPIHTQGRHPNQKYNNWLVFTWCSKPPQSNGKSKPRFQSLSPVCCPAPQVWINKLRHKVKCVLRHMKMIPPLVFIEIVEDIWPEERPVWSLSRPHSPSRDQTNWFRRTKRLCLRGWRSRHLSISNRKLLLLNRSSNVDLIAQTGC